MPEIRLLDSAARELAELDPAIARRIVSRLKWLAEHLDEAPLHALTGELSGLYKFRVGAYRVVFQVLRDDRVLLVHGVGHRRDVYRRR